MKTLVRRLSSLVTALAALAASADPATNAPAAAVSAEAVVAERTRAMVARLDRIVVPEFAFQDARLVDICSLLQGGTGCYCELGVVSKVAVWAEGPLQRRLDRDGVRVSLSVTNAPLGQVALRIAEQVGAELVAGESFLLFRDRGAPPWDPAPFFARPGADAAAAEEVLDRVRIPGSDCLYADLRDVLRVVQARSACRDPDGPGVSFGPDGLPPPPPEDERGERPSTLDESALRATLDRWTDGSICFPMPPRVFLREALEIVANAAGAAFVFEPDGRLSVAESGRPAPDDPGGPASARRLPLPAAREATLAALGRIRPGDAFAATEDEPGLRDFLRRLDEAARAAEPSGGGLRFDVAPDVPAEARCHGEDIRHLSDGCLRELLDAALLTPRYPWFVRADGTIAIRPAPGSPGDPATNATATSAAENASLAEPIEIRVTPSPDSRDPAFEVETWLFEMSSDDLRKLQRKGVFADKPAPAPPCFPDCDPPVPVRGAEDGIRPGLDVFTEPQRQVLFRAISNLCGSAVVRHAPPMAVRSYDRLDVSASGCVFSASPVLSGDRARFDLFLAVDLKPGSSSGPLLPFEKEPNASAFPASSVCVLLPSRETDGRARIVVWKATATPPGTRSPAADESHAESAKKGIAQ